MKEYKSKIILQTVLFYFFFFQWSLYNNKQDRELKSFFDKKNITYRFLCTGSQRVDQAHSNMQ